MKNKLFDIKEFEVGKILTHDEFVNTKRTYAKDFSHKSYLDGKFFVYYKKNDNPLLVHDIAEAYRKEHNDNALLIFIQKHGEASLVCFIDSSNTFYNNKVLIQEIDIKRYENDYRKMEETIVHFSTKRKRPIKVFMPSKEDEEASLEMIDKIFNDFTLCTQEELKAFFPKHTLSKQKLQSFTVRATITIALSFIISDFSMSSLREYAHKEDQIYLSSLAQKRFNLQNTKAKMENNEYILKENEILNAQLKEIAR